MRRQPENNAWQDPSPDRIRASDRGKKPDHKEDPAPAPAGSTSSAKPENAGLSPDLEARDNRKMENLNDREDLSERQLSNRNWL
jgi:hypothetical protein